jgi:hypothetical protein
MITNPRGSWIPLVPVCLLAVAVSGCQTLMLNSLEASQTDLKAPFGMYYALPRGFVTLTVKSEDDAKKLAAGQLYNLEVTAPQFEPDPAHYYRINAAWDIGSDDHIVIETTDQGILKSIATTSKDQRVEIVKKLIELAGSVAKIGVAGVPGLPEAAPAVPAIQVSHRVDIANPAHIAAFNRALIAANADAQIIVDRPEINSVALGIGDDIPRNNAGCTIGICFRPLIPYTISLVSRATPAAAATQSSAQPAAQVQAQMGPPQTVYQRATTLLPNGAPLLSIGITRASYVEKTSTYTFAESGIPTKADVTKPSEAVGFANIPVAVAAAIVSIPSDLMTFRIKQATDETSYLNSLKALLEAQQNYLKALKDASATTAPAP